MDSRSSLLLGGPANITTSTRSLINTSGTPSPPPFLPWANPDNILSKETHITIVTTISLSVVPLLFLVGAPTNLLSAVVFWRQGLKDRNNLCLFVLALVDLVYVTSLLAFAMSAFVGLVDEALAQRYRSYCKLHFGGALWAMKLTSGCISAIIAVDRCLCVVFPLKLESLMSTRTMGLLLGGVTIALQLLYLVHRFSNDIQEVVTAEGGRVYSIVPSAFYLQNRVFADAVDIVLLSFVIPIATFVIVSVATTITVVKLRHALLWRQATSSSAGPASRTNQQTTLTTMLVLLSCVYIVFAAPLVAFTLMRLAIPGYSYWGRYSNFFQATQALGTICTMVNSSVNFFVYYNRSSRFRQVLASLCARLARKGGDAETVKAETQMSSIAY